MYFLTSYHSKWRRPLGIKNHLLFPHLFVTCKNTIFYMLLFTILWNFQILLNTSSSSFSFARPPYECGPWATESTLSRLSTGALIHQRLHQKFDTLTFSGLTAWSSVEVCSKWSGHTSSQRPARSVYPSSELSDFSGSSRSPSKSTTWGQCQRWRWWWFQCCLFSILMHPKA